MEIFIIQEADPSNLALQDVIELPVIPAEFSVGSPQDNRKFETMNNGVINIPGNRGLLTVSWSAFFPSREYGFNLNDDYLGFDIVEKLELFRTNKTPVQLILTETNINGLFLIDSFEYGQDTASDIPYSIVFTEFKIPRVERV